MSYISFLGAIEAGLILSLVALAVYISFRILNFPDLTVDGSYPLGAAITAILIINGYNPYFALIIAFMGGYLSGLITAFLNVKFKILHLLAGILVMTALYSVNIRIMGASFVSLNNLPTVFTPFENIGIPEDYVKIVVLGMIVIIVKLILDIFLVSKVGLAIRSTGMNPLMAKSQSVNTRCMTYLGIGVSNGIVAIAGGLFAQYNLSSDVTVGIGTIIFGLAAVILGETFIKSRNMVLSTIACVIGAILFKIATALALEIRFLGMTTSDLNLIIAIIITAALVIPYSRSSLSARLHRKAVRNE